MSAYVNKNASKKDLKQVRQYLENMDPDDVEKVYAKGKYASWHGDSKSQSNTKITFQTKSMETSGKPVEYVTIATEKGRTEPYVTHVSTTWGGSAKEIIDAMKKVL